jgi:hypothetical protein
VETPTLELEEGLVLVEQTAQVVLDSMEAVAEVPLEEELEETPDREGVERT